MQAWLGRDSEGQEGRGFPSTFAAYNPGSNLLLFLSFHTKNREWLCTNSTDSQVQDCVIKLKKQANNVLSQDKLSTLRLPLRVPTLQDPHPGKLPPACWNTHVYHSNI